jgi:hypothetical protein
MYYTTIPLVSERPHNRRWDASKLRELRKKLDSGTMTVEEIDQVAADFLDGEIVDLASDWLGNTVSLLDKFLKSLFSIQICIRSYKNFSKDAQRPPVLLCWNASLLTWL